MHPTTGKLAARIELLPTRPACSALRKRECVLPPYGMREAAVGTVSSLGIREAWAWHPLTPWRVGRLAAGHRRSGSGHEYVEQLLLP